MTSRSGGSKRNADSSDAAIRNAQRLGHMPKYHIDPDSPLFSDDLEKADSSEMSRLIGTFDWSRTPLGPMAQWPRSLKTMLSVCLHSRFQLAIYWGPDLIFLYNDAQREVMGSLHPYALGKPGREIMVDMWDTIEPMLHRVLETGEATWSVDRPLLFDRYGFVEKVYFTWSYSPIPGDVGDIGGVLLVTQETTERVLAERRLRMLKEMATETGAAESVEQACATAMRILADNSDDIPFALLYVPDATGSVSLVSSSDVSARPTGQQFPFERVSREREVVQIDNLARYFGGGGAPRLTKTALILPIRDSGLENLAGFLVVGVTDHLRFDTAYRNFFDLVGSQVGTLMASARAREQERKRLNAIAELDRAKTAFFTNVSHEFRTPLTLILGVTDGMLRRPASELGDRQREELSIIRRNGVRLLRLVSTILTFSGIEAGRVQAAYRPTDLRVFTEELASGFRELIEQAGITFRVQLKTLPEPVYVDIEMWEKIVLNLLSNAFKFTFNGEVSLTLACVNNAAQLVVRDTGIGIQPDQLPHLFERFHRAESSHGRTHEGSGIGLALVSEFVKLHGGSIGAESTPGEGSSFVVSIPFGAEHLPPDRVHEGRGLVTKSLAMEGFAEEARLWLPAIESADNPPSTGYPRPQSSRDRPLVLVADDNPDMRHYVGSLLNHRYTVETVSNGEEALAAIQRRKPDLVLADVMMPQLDGINLLSRLRADPETRTIPVIMLSARAGEEEKIAGMELGADDYIVKPFGFRELLARVQSHIELANIRRHAAERERELRAEADRERVLLEMVLNEMPAGVIITEGSSGAVLRANRLAEEILQCPAPHIGQIQDCSQVFRLSGGQYEAREFPLTRSVQQGEIVIGEELRYLCPDGTFRMLLTNSAPVRDGEGKIVAGVFAFQDVTELRSTQQELLRQSNKVIHQLTGKLITAQEEERKRIARDLHDDLAQRLALLCIKMEALRRGHDAGSNIEEQLADMKTETHAAAERIRQISHHLHHSCLALGLSRAVARYCQEFSELHGIRTEFTHTGPVTALPEPIPLIMFRVLQEALSNVVKHSGADHAEVSLMIDDDAVKLRIKDCGKGFDPSLSCDGLGLISMRERLRVIEGKIKVTSALGRGTELEATVPRGAELRPL